MKECLQCSTQNVDKMAFCKKCGQRLPAAATGRSFRPVVIIAALMAALFIALLTIKVLYETGIIDH